MLINLRDALMTGKRLPYDAEVEYLESTGTQYVNTGVLIDTSTDTVEIAFMPHTETSGYQAYYGTDETGNGQFSLRKNTNGNNIQVLKNTAVSAGITADEKWHTVKVTPNKAIVDGVDIALTQSDAQYTKSLMLFARITTADTITAYAKCRIASFKIYRNGTLVRDLIPVRKGTVGYLYDRVSGKLFGNAGTGDFVVGPDVVPVEYIESHGTEYIDTGVVPSGQTKWELDVMFPNVNGFRPMGTIATNPPRRFVIARELVSTIYSISFGSYDNTQKGIDSGIRRLCVIDAPNFTWSIGARSGTFTEGTFDISGIQSICLFVRKRNSGYDYLNDGSRVYRSTLYTSGSRIQDLRSVRVGTEGAMMDVLTRRIYRNAGTGAFDYGNDLKYPIPAE